MRPIIALDVETRSDVELTTAGAYEYFDSPHTEVYLASYCDLYRPDRVFTWWLGEPPPWTVLHSPLLILAHNAEFEWLAWTRYLTPKQGWPEVRLEQFVCTATLARACGLPGSLDRAVQCLELTDRKISSGYQLMLKCCKPIGWSDEQTERYATGGSYTE